MLIKTSATLVRSIRCGIRHFSIRSSVVPLALTNPRRIDGMMRPIVVCRRFATTAGGSHGAATKSDDCGGNKFAPACIQPPLVATFADIEDLPNHPEKLLIDVREPSELAATGQIPTSINIPLKTVRTELGLNPDAFEAKYGRKKPTTEDPIIFSCRSGVRAGQAAFEADQLGFRNVKNYVGSWLEYAAKHDLPV